MNPFFSIVIPTYNRAELVSECIRSVLEQTFGRFEIIVVDDGSTDTTEEAVKAITSDKLFYYKKNNEERGAARNFGIKKSQGQYITFLDSDDRMKPNHLAMLYAHLEHTQEDFTATKYNFFDGITTEISRDVKLLSAGYHTYTTFLIGNPLACCFTVRRENPDLILFNEDRDISIMEDWIFLLENLHNKKLFILDVYTLEMRDHSSRSMRQDNGRIVKARRRATDYVRSVLTLTLTEEKSLKGHSSYFCAVHYYLDGDTSNGFYQLYDAVKLLGLTKNGIFLLIKLIFQFLWRKQKRREF